MDLKRVGPKSQFRLSRFKIGLYILGIIICMSLLAAIPPITKNSINKLPLKGADKNVATSLKNNSANLLSIQTADVQTGSGAGQGNNQSVQGPVPDQNPINNNQPVDSSPVDNQDPSLSNPVINPPIQEHPCFFCGGFHIMCPMIALPCSGCGSTAAYVCLEE